MVVKTILFKWPHCCELVGPLSWSYIEDTILKQASWSLGSYHISALSSVMSPESPGSRLGCGVLTGLWISRPLMLRIFTENDGKARFFHKHCFEERATPSLPLPFPPCLFFLFLSFSPFLSFTFFKEFLYSSGCWALTSAPTPTPVSSVLGSQTCATTLDQF